MFAGIQASPPQKPEKKESPVASQSSPLQGQNVLSFSPARPPSTSPKFSPSCVSAYSPPLSSPSSPGSGRNFSPSVAYGKVSLHAALETHCFFIWLSRSFAAVAAQFSLEIYMHVSFNHPMCRSSLFAPVTASTFSRRLFT